MTRQPPDHQPSGAAASPGIPALTAGQTSTRHQPRHRTGRGLLPRAQRDPVFVSGASDSRSVIRHARHVLHSW